MLVAFAVSALGAGKLSPAVKRKPQPWPVSSALSDHQRMAQIKALMTRLKRGIPLSQAMALLKGFEVQEDGGISAMNEARYFLSPDIMVDFTLERDYDPRKPTAGILSGPPKVYRSPRHFN